VPDLKPVVGSQVPSEDGSPYPEPFASKATSTAFRQLAAHFGLSQFGVNLITLDPGAQSGLRHWHSLEDEFLYVLEGEITLRMNNDSSFYPDDDLAWFDPGNGAIAVHKDGTPYP
jgi:uncharacterized cupin superfamily protein